MAGMTWGSPEKKPDSALIHAKGQVTSATNKAEAISKGLEQGASGQAGRVEKAQRLTGTLHLPEKPVTGNTERLRRDRGKEQHKETG